MSLPQEWLVFFFFVLIALALLMIYEIKSKFIWKSEAAKLQKENEILRAKILNESLIPRLREGEYVIQIPPSRRFLRLRKNFVLFS